MAYFKEGRKTKKVNLLSNPDYWVEIYTDIKWGQSKHALQIKEDGTVDMVISADKLLQMMILDWNLDDEKGDKAPINEEWIDKLEPSDALYLAREAGAEEAENESKKKS